MNLSWVEKTDILISKSLLSNKQIMLLFDLGQPNATEIRHKVKELAKKKGRWIGEKKVPTDLVLEVMGLDFEYFSKMAKNEKLLADMLIEA